MKRRVKPKQGDIVEVKWLDSGTTSKVDATDEAAKLKCHVATCWGEVVLIDEDRLVLWGERYDDNSGRVEAIHVASIQSISILRRAK